ncbi:MAG: DNA polymerase I [Gammaproteobacteria bacterium]|nr:DNA polymerase I [Gammaproteobacteria bacterium]
MSDSAPLVLVDGSSYLYRAFHVPELQRLSTSRGEPTGAILGVGNMVRKLHAEYRPEYMAVVFDAKGKTFRDELYDQYKANRPPMPDELRAQIEPLHQVLAALGYPLPIIPGVEADDVIGTLTREAQDAGMRVLISTGDKDMAQLVNDRVTLTNTMSNTSLDRDGVLAKFGVPPGQMIDFLALVGDSSDNVPGVPKCGPKTAAKWLAEYGSLDVIMANADRIKGKIGENLRASLDHLPLSRQLVTIKLDVEMDLHPADLRLRERDLAAMRELFVRWELKSWLADIDDGAAPVSSAAAADRNYATLTSPADFEAWLEKLHAAEYFAFDTETTDLQYMQAEIVGLSFSVQPGEAAYVPVAHAYPGAPEQLDRDWVLKKLRPLLQDPEHKKVGQNLKYDRSVLANYGIEMNGIAHDTMLQSYVLDSTATRHDMDSLAEKYLAVKTVRYEDIGGKGAKQLTFDHIDLEQAAPYACEDADIALQLHECLWSKLAAIPSLRNVYETIEMPLVPVLSRMERNGVLLDTKMLAAQTRELAEKMLTLEARAHELAGGAFNLGSPKQIQEILYKRLELPVLRKTPKGQPSTAEDTLAELAHDYQLPQAILDHRGLSKLRSTYTDKLPEMISSKTGRLHTSYRQAVASTGRLSSNDPNLQNIPVRTEEGRRIRQAFIAPPGSKLLAADYSQIELRIMAHLSRDASLLSAFAKGQDIHRSTAAEVFGADLNSVTAEQRRAAKAINFGLIYGMSAFGLGRQLGIKRSEAQEYVDLYFSRYPGVKEYMEKTRERAHEYGFVETVFGRRLYLPTINARNGQIRAAAERTAINAPMQGSAADIIKRAMISVDDWLQRHDFAARMIMQVHDELVFEVAIGQERQLEKMVRRHMQGAADLEVELVVDVGVGDNWDQAH